MAATFCSFYEGSGSSWPIQTFPKTLFPFLPNNMLTEKAKAWNFYELVESYDASLRYRGATYGWYVFGSEGERLMYREGQLLHSQLCPNTNWTSQRNLGPSAKNIYPPHC
jgi:hypothetical protein